MVLSGKTIGTPGAPIDDIAYLARATHRVPTLAAVSERPRSRSELCELTGVSSSTVRRTIRSFEERNWIRRHNGLYEATQLGRFVALSMRDVLDRMNTEQQLRSVWHWLPDEADGFTVEMCADAVVTVAKPDAPYCPVNRFEALLREADRFYFVGSDIALLEPCKDILKERILDGMETEIIDPPSVARYVLSTYPDHCLEPLECPNCTILVHDELPSYGIGMLDDRVVLSCFDEASGTVRVLVDTDHTDAREWANSLHASVRTEARPLALDVMPE